MQLVKALVSAHEELASWRQHLHQNPEIAYEEKDTSDFVAAKLESFGIEVHRGFGGTGLVGVIKGNLGDPESGKLLAFAPIWMPCQCLKKPTLPMLHNVPAACMLVVMMDIRPCFLPRRGTLPKREIFKAPSIVFSNPPKKVAMLVPDQ
jgi:hypothetical protein